MEDLFSRLTQPDFRYAYKYWKSSCRGDRLPSRADIDPIDLCQVLPIVNMVDVVQAPSGLRFRHRIVGEELIARFQSDHVGQWFDDLYTSHHLRKVLPAYLEAVTHRRATLGNVHVDDNGLHLLRYARLIMPLDGPDGIVESLFILFAFQDIGHQVAVGRGLPLHRDGQGSRADRFAAEAVG